MVAPLLLGSILDLGSGYGGLTSLLKKDQIYLGVDGNPGLIELMRTKHPGYRFRCLNFDTDRLDLGEKFDTIVLLAVLEHLKQPAHLFSQLHDCLNPGGSIVLTTPDPMGKFYSLDRRQVRPVFAGSRRRSFQYLHPKEITAAWTGNRFFDPDLPHISWGWEPALRVCPADRTGAPRHEGDHHRAGLSISRRDCSLHCSASPGFYRCAPHQPGFFLPETIPGFFIPRQIRQRSKSGPS